MAKTIQIQKPTLYTITVDIFEYVYDFLRFSNHKFNCLYLNIYYFPEVNVKIHTFHFFIYPTLNHSSALLPFSFFNTWQHNQSGSRQTLKTPPAILNGRILYYKYQGVPLVCKCAHFKGKKNTGVSVEISVKIIDTGAL